MQDSLASILLRIGKTGLLVGALGLVLYGGVTVIAEWPGAHLLLAILLALPLALLISRQVLDAWRSGAFPVWQGVVTRDDRPLAFRANMAWYGACALLLHALWLWAGWRFFLG